MTKPLGVQLVHVDCGGAVFPAQGGIDLYECYACGEKGEWVCP